MPRQRTRKSHSQAKFRDRVLNAARLRGDYTCGICKQFLNLDLMAGFPESPEADHIIPHAKGGTDSVENGRAVHRQCNQERGDRVENKPPAVYDDPDALDWL